MRTAEAGRAQDAPHTGDRELQLFVLGQELAEVLVVQAAVDGLIEPDDVLAEGWAEAAG